VYSLLGSGSSKDTILARGKERRGFLRPRIKDKVELRCPSNTVLGYTRTGRVMLSKQGCHHLSTTSSNHGIPQPTGKV
jgi:hypothetical protein